MASSNSQDPTRKLRIVQIREGKGRRLGDLVIREVPLTIFLNDVNLATFMCSPGNLRELAIGFLFTENVIQKIEDIRSIIVDEREGAVWVRTKGTHKRYRDFLSRRLITTGCGRGLSFYDPSQGEKPLKIRSRIKVGADELTSLMKEFQRRSELYRSTGGVHSAALCDRSDVLVLREDIGRHNAIDKVIGECLLNEIDMNDRVLVTSGRVSSDMVIKAARANIPVILSKSAPTALGVSIAKGFGMTLVGFARGSRMNVYSHAERVSPGTIARSFQ